MLQERKHLLMLKDDKTNAKAVLGSLAQLLSEPLSQILATTDNTMEQQRYLCMKDLFEKNMAEIDFSKAIAAQEFVDESLSKGVSEREQAALNEALEVVEAFEKQLKAGRAFDLKVVIAQTESRLHKLSFLKWLADNNARTVKELATRNKEVCEMIAQRLPATLQAELQDHLSDGPLTVRKLLKFLKEGLELARGTYDIRLLAITQVEFDSHRPYNMFLTMLSQWADSQRARTADGISMLPNVVLWNLYTSMHFKATNDMATREKLLKLSLQAGLPDQSDLEAILDSASRLLRIQGDPATPTATTLSSSYAQKAAKHTAKGKGQRPSPKIAEKKPSSEKPSSGPEPHIDVLPGHCRNFAKHGACRFGKECLYKHVRYDQGKPAPVVRVVTFGSKASSAAAAAEEDDGHEDDQQFFGGPEAHLA